MGTKLLLVAALVLFVIPLASATQDSLILSPAPPYNLGDQVDVILYLTTGQGITTIDIDFVGPEKMTDVGNLVLDKSGYQRIKMPYTFSKEFHVGTFKAVAKIEAGNTTKTFETPDFNVSDKLLANLVFNQDKFMIGETLSIYGDILKQNFNPAPSGEIQIFGKPAFFVDGEYKLEQAVKSTTPKSINISVKDNHGNSAQIFKEIQVASKPYLNATVNKKEFLPGNEILVASFVKNIRNEDSKYTAEVLFDNQAYSLSGSGSLKFSQTIPENAIAKTYSIQLKVWDEFNNYASQNFSIKVIPVLKELALAIQKESYMPEEAMAISITGKDQAAEPYASGQGTLRVIDEKGNPSTSQEILLNSEGSYNSSLAAPLLAGNWIIRIEIGNLKQEKTISVKEIGKITLDKVNTKSGILTGTITNQKNRNYETITLLIKARDGTVIKEIPVQLASGQTIDLSELNLEVPEGAYIELKSGEAVLVSSGGWLTGMAIGNVSPAVSATAIVILIIVGAIIFIAVKRRKPKEISSPSDTSIRLKEVKKNLKEIKQKIKENYLKKFKGKGV